MSSQMSRVLLVDRKREKSERRGSSVCLSYLPEEEGNTFRLSDLRHFWPLRYWHDSPTGEMQDCQGTANVDAPEHG